VPPNNDTASKGQDDTRSKRRRDENPFRFFILVVLFGTLCVGGIVFLDLTRGSGIWKHHTAAEAPASGQAKK
jgi:hypothetical protein